MGEHVEDVERVAVAVVGLLAGLAVHGGNDRRGDHDAGEPPGQSAAELVHGEGGGYTGEGGRVRGVTVGESERFFQGRPVPFGLLRDGREVGVSAEQPEENDGQQPWERMTHPTTVTRVRESLKSRQ